MLVAPPDIGETPNFLSHIDFSLSRQSFLRLS